MPPLIIFLQNAWSPVYAGQQWPRRSWLRALATSHTGRRLRLITDDLTCVHNVSPVCTAEPSGVAEPDHEHVLAILRSHAPRVVLACGKPAEATLRHLWLGPLLCVPHPAHRVVTNTLYLRARELIVEGVKGQWALRQLRGAIEHQRLSRA